MMKINKLSVTVTYKVGLGNLDMPKKVYDQINEAIKNGDKIDATNIKYGEAGSWLSDKIKERDCFEWEAEIDQIN